MTILVVDDEPEFRVIMKSVLMAEGWDVVLAEHGEDALSKLKDMKIDMVISDIYMPVMDGIKFHRTVRAHPEFANLPFLFVSAYDDEHTLEAVQDPQYDGFLRKARPVEEMFEWIGYLTTDVAKRPKAPPGGFRYKSGVQPRRVVSRGLNNTLIL